MIEVPIDRIIPVNEARSQFDRIMEDIQTDSLYVVISKEGKPSAAIINIDYLEKVTGDTRPKMVGVEGPKEKRGPESVTEEAQTTPEPKEEESKTETPTPSETEETPIEEMPITSAPSAPKAELDKEDKEVQPSETASDIDNPNQAVIDALSEEKTPPPKEENQPTKSDQIKTMENPFSSPPSSPSQTAKDNKDKISEMEI